MKKLFAGFVLFVITVILLSSCGNSSKLELTKRHYRSGYYVDFRSKSQTTTASVAKLALVKNKQPMAPVITAKSESYSNVNISMTVSDKLPIAAKMVVPKKMQENNLISNNVTSTSQKALVINTSTTNDISASAGDGHSNRNSVSVPFVVIVLCAIFVPPLGVGLMYGITSYFWIDLILTLLFFFPGMIFALIVVLM